MGILRTVAFTTVVAALCGASRIMDGDNGWGVDAESFAGGVLHLRVRKNAEQFEVSDVVVAPPTGWDREDCSGAAGVCTLVSGDATYVVEKTDAGISVKLSVAGKEIVSGVFGHKAEDKPIGKFSFPHADHFYGIPQRATDLSLEKGGSYRLFNLDVFEYKIDDKGPLYGAIPFLMAHGTDSTAAVLWLNSADSTVEFAPGGKTASWESEGGIVDVFFFPGPTPVEVHRQHASVVGPTQLPPQFALGYHQCRWNYRSVADSLEVDAGFDHHNIPYDVLWLDIEHTDGKRYFTWDPHTFPDPERLVARLEAKNRKLVTITDPHIKRATGYHVHEEATSKGFYVKTESGSDFEGDCWPGRSSWVDFYNKNARDWYATLFQYDRYKASSPSVFSWIDMNEPSVFNAHEVTMDKRAVHTAADGRKVSHGQLHNMYGYYHTMAAYDGHINRNKVPMRPFVLTRSFFSGSQRYAAMWTGDNMAEWSHLKKSIPMLLSLSLSNYAFVGADIGGFFKNPSEELLVRWYQAAALTPFFRGHAHLETKRREPWLFGKTVTDRIRRAIARRYALMPYLYTTFAAAHDEGMSVMRPLFYEWPTDAALGTEQSAFMLGQALLSRPVVDEGAESFDIILPVGTSAAPEKWYSLPSGEHAVAGQKQTIAVTMDSMPTFVRGGYILPTRQRLRRSTAAAAHDPFTLYVAVGHNGTAAGNVYMDDGESFAFANGGYLLKRLTFEDGKLTARSGSTIRARPDGSFTTSVVVERVVIFGMQMTPSAVAVAGSDAAGAAVEVADHGVAVVSHLRLPIAADWTVELK